MIKKLKCPRHNAFKQINQQNSCLTNILVHIYQQKNKQCNNTFSSCMTTVNQRPYSLSTWLVSHSPLKNWQRESNGIEQKTASVPFPSMNKQTPASVDCRSMMFQSVSIFWLQIIWRFIQCQCYDCKSQRLRNHAGEYFAKWNKPSSLRSEPG